MAEQRPRWVALVALIALASTATAQDHSGHGEHAMSADADGMTMNANADRLPDDCAQIRAEHHFEVRAGRTHAQAWPGTMFGFSASEWRVSPCSRVTITLINEDEVRHQWMLHGLPRYLYPGGMFHLEAAGGRQRTASFIVPSDERTYLVHCDLAQHMEKGMKAQLKAGRGSGDLWSIPGISGDLVTNRGETAPFSRLALAAFALSILAAIIAFRALNLRRDH